MDCRANGEVTFTGATPEFQLKKGLTQSFRSPVGLEIFRYLTASLVVSTSSFPIVNIILTPFSPVF